ncbi:hypothetical protein K435DRAFT_842743 [Dendrothele bispora CBS 962.96]|uniref:Uncharacterized protein n=1 Tax=Dendrothele bispora (strain CBS 962.96) TaxID=1314807 RepID=A0A4S8LDQ1_DENBC|nr:hypothetical protein K435DRAFT_842743 [Dendrothele bispora CBS 962.96]
MPERDPSFQHNPAVDSPQSFSFSTAQPETFRFIFNGGVGGLLIGYSFGLHLTTFLSLLISNSFPSISPLSEKLFIAIWLLPSLLTTFLGSQYKYAALAFGGVTGGVMFSLAISVIICPSLLTWIVLPSIITPILNLPIYLPLDGSNVSPFDWLLALPAHSDLSRSWLKLSLEWEGSKEHGLDAGFCLFPSVGIASDDLLRRLFGQCPNEQRDKYLANYTSNLPDRAGTFKPFEFFWDRWFSSKSSCNSRNSTGDKETIFPEEPKHPVKSSPPKHFLLNFSPILTQPFCLTPINELLWQKSKQRKLDLALVPDGFVLSGEMRPMNYQEMRREGFRRARSNLNKTKGFTAKNLGKDAGEGVRKKRDLVKFRPDEGSLSSDEYEDGSSEDEQKMKPLQGMTKPLYLKQSISMAGTNTAIGLIDYEIEGLKRRTTQGLGGGEVTDYLDYESDLGTPTTLTLLSIGTKEKEGGWEWTPGFPRTARYVLRRTQDLRACPTVMVVCLIGGSFKLKGGEMTLPALHQTSLKDSGTQQWFQGCSLALRGMVDGGDRRWNGNCVVKYEPHWKQDNKGNSGWIRGTY